MARVSSTVTKRTSNPRPRKYASASERQAAYRARAPEVCFRAEQKTVETLDRIAETLDQSRADVLLSMTKFALANHDWARFGLTHKPLPFEYGVNPLKKMTKRQEVIEFGKRMGFKASAGKGFVYLTNMVGWGETFDDWDQAHAYLLKAYDDHYVNRTPYPWDYKENPAMKTTRAKRKPTPAQLAARERFAEMARSGAFAKGRKRNPAGSGTVKMKIRGSETPDNPEGLIVTEAGALRWAKQNMPKDLKRAGFVPSVVAGARGWSINYGAAVPGHSTYSRNPAKKTVSQKISQLTREGYPNRQAVAIALNEERAGKVRRNPAPAKQRMGRIVRVDPKTGVPFGTELVPIDFTFKEWVGNYQQDFFARTEGAQLVVSEKTTGAKVGAVPFTLRSAALNDRAAAKAFVQKTVEKVGADRFNAAIAKAPKLTA